MSDDENGSPKPNVPQINMFPLFGSLSQSISSPLYEGPDASAEVMMSDSLLRPAPPLFQPPPPARLDESKTSSEGPGSPALSRGSSARRRSSSTQLPSEDKRTRSMDIVDEGEAPLQRPTSSMVALHREEPVIGTSQILGRPLTASSMNGFPPIADEKRKKNPSFLNSRPRFYELNNDSLLADVWNALIKGQTTWLSAKEVQALLDFCKAMQLGARAPHRPPSGTIFYFDSRAGEYFRRDGYDYVKKRGSGISVREDHVKLRQGAISVIYASYVHSAEWIEPGTGASLFHRRSYWLVDSDEKDRGVIVHYLGNRDSDSDPVTRAHELECECVLCCLKSENSRADRPGESLEQILSRADSQNFKQTTKRSSSTSGAVTNSDATVKKATKKRTQKRRNGEEEHDEIDEDDQDYEEVDSFEMDSNSPHPAGPDSATSTAAIAMDPVLPLGRRDVPKRAAAPQRPLVEGGDETSSESEDHIERHGLGRMQTAKAKVVSSHSRNNLPPISTGAHASTSSFPFNFEPLSPSAQSNDVDFEFEPLPSILTPVNSRRVSHMDMELGAALDHELFADLATPSAMQNVDSMFFGDQEGHHQRRINDPARPPAEMMMIPPPPPSLSGGATSKTTNSMNAERQDSMAMLTTGEINTDKAKKPVARFELGNVVVAACAPDRMREGVSCLVVLSMRSNPETLNYRTWVERVAPRVQIWFGEYRLPVVEPVALGVIKFTCPPHFRSESSDTGTSPFICRLETRSDPLPFIFSPLPSWESSGGVSLGGDLKRRRPSFTPVKTFLPDSDSRFGMIRDGGIAEIAENRDEEEVEEAEDEEESLDRRATLMIERVVKLMTSSQTGASAAEMINEVSPENGFNFLHTAVFCGATVDIVQTLLNHGADANIRTNNPDRNSPLHLACDQGNVAVARILIKSGADISALNGHGLSPVEVILSREENESDTELFALLGFDPSNTNILPSDGFDKSDPSQEKNINFDKFSQSPMRIKGAASPRTATPHRASLVTSSLSLGASMASTVGGDSSGSHMVLLREALSSLSLREQYALAVAVSSDSNERKSRRSTSIASSADIPGAFSGNPPQGSEDATTMDGETESKNQGRIDEVAGSEDEGEDDVACVVTENQKSVLAAMGDINNSEKEQLDFEARKIQSNVRAWILRRQFKEIREAARKVQALAKGHLARRHFRELREKASATLVIQKSLRAHIKARRSRNQQPVGLFSPSQLLSGSTGQATMSQDRSTPPQGEFFSLNGQKFATPRSHHVNFNSPHVDSHLLSTPRLDAILLGTPNNNNSQATRFDFHQDPSLVESSTIGGANLGDRRFSSAPGTNQPHAADEFIMSGLDPFDVNMRDD